MFTPSSLPEEHQLHHLDPHSFIPGKAVVPRILTHLEASTPPGGRLSEQACTLLAKLDGGACSALLNMILQRNSHVLLQLEC